MKKNKNIFYLGIVMVLLGVFKLINFLSPDYILPYIFNYQVLLFLIGVYLLIKNGINHIGSLVLIVVSIYLYIQEFVDLKFINIVLPVVLIICGLVLIYMYIFKDKKGE